MTPTEPTSFSESLARFVRGFCEAEEKERHRLERLRACQDSISWLEREIDRVLREAERRPRLLRHVDELRRQIRGHEIEIAFLDADGARP